MQKAEILDRLRAHWLFRRPDRFGSARDTILWWEIRRIPYNIIVGIVGMITCGTLVGIALYRNSTPVTKDADLGNPFFGVIMIILYGIMANVCYSAGWITELIVEKMWGDRRGRYGEIVFVLGLCFSICLTFLPLIVFGPFALFATTSH
jgi:hypothetical protein